MSSNKRSNGQGEGLSCKASTHIDVEEVGRGKEEEDVNSDKNNDYSEEEDIDNDATRVRKTKRKKRDPWDSYSREALYRKWKDAVETKKSCQQSYTYLQKELKDERKEFKQLKNLHKKQDELITKTNIEIESNKCETNDLKRTLKQEEKHHKNKEKRLIREHEQQLKAKDSIIAKLQKENERIELAKKKKEVESDASNIAFKTVLKQRNDLAIRNFKLNAENRELKNQMRARRARIVDFQKVSALLAKKKHEEKLRKRKSCNKKKQTKRYYYSSSSDSSSSDDDDSTDSSSSDSSMSSDSDSSCEKRKKKKKNSSKNNSHRAKKKNKSRRSA